MKAFKAGWSYRRKDEKAVGYYIAFTLKNETDGQLDYYWLSRESELLIRGGANYAYDQIEAELSKFMTEQFQLKPEQFQLVVVGLRLGSEHEDRCCVTIQLSKKVADAESQLKPRTTRHKPEVSPALGAFKSESFRPGLTWR